MSSPRTLLLAAALAAPFAAMAIQDCELNGQSVNPANGSTTAGKTGLMRCKDRDSGELQREQELKNGVFMGIVRYYGKGQLIKEHSVNANGNVEGRAREFSPTGQVLREATYVNGSERGLVRSFHPNGQLRRASFYAEAGGEQASVEFNESGQLSALRCGDRPMLAPAADDAKLCGFGGRASEVELFDTRGTLRTRAVWASGKRQRSENLYDNGKPSAQEEITGSQRTERRFSAEGVKRTEIVWLLTERGGIRQVEQAFSETGTLVREQRWNATGEPVSDKSFFLNGQPRSQSVYSGSGESRTLENTTFHDNGQRASLGRYSAPPRGRQMPAGTHQRFDDKGTLVAESVYDAKGRVTRERAWDEAGKLQRDDEVFEDGSRKAFAK
ncbi:toxin-antitoxin system YwqK family antitoxin [Variovorax fucosicus]|uniref:toxin-antitoxin system YwqK family antitoxin n=1 Tax=Variovorax fucosicus TaxID=3053517 RepID=UPI002577A453|nr:hypothetical protein [Variovorax sp. J22G47]MDM0055653.1 hypothetical protein [Variovorax sp. J22G47]